ncbi:MAG: OmpA family protein [Syntrophobacterales bacterium]|jgi:peptidoglycan-associated lipoprotein|nr:OmpA family protein [Syntrophobacterales bacterium]
MKYWSGLVIFLVVLMVYGCGTPKVISSGEIKEPQRHEVITDHSNQEGEGVISEEELARAEKDRLLGQRRGAGVHDQAGEREQKSALFQDILFDYDSYAIKTEDIPRLKNIGAWLNRTRNVKLTVEGHCDERGTQEYNLVLGQKRSEAIKEYLVKTGVETNKINAVSYGKEVPVDQTRTEEAWALNRRVHFNVN